MPTQFILIDFENVQPDNLSQIGADDFKILVFVGATQTKLPRDLVLKLQLLGDRAQYVEIEGSGHNALDFHIAYYIGHLAAQHPQAVFHIITKDTGFDLLIKHLKTKAIKCHRWFTLEAIPNLKRAPVVPVPVPAKAPAVSPMAKKAAAALDKNHQARPRTHKKLCAFLKSILGPQAPEARVTELLAELQQQGVLTVTDTKVTYPEP